MTHSNKPKHLMAQRSAYGMKAKSAILAGTMAFALFPAAAIASPAQGGMEQPQQQMQQMVGGQQAPQGQGQQAPQGQAPQQNRNQQAPQQNQVPQAPQAPQNQAPQQNQNQQNQGQQAPKQNQSQQAPQNQNQQAPQAQQNQTQQQAPAQSEVPQQNAGADQQPTPPAGQQQNGTGTPNGEIAAGTESDVAHEGPQDLITRVVKGVVELLGVQIDETKIDEMVASVFKQFAPLAGGQAQSSGQQGQAQPSDSQGQPPALPDGAQPADSQGQPPALPDGAQPTGEQAQPQNDTSWMSDGGAALSGGQRPSLPGDQSSQAGGPEQSQAGGSSQSQAADQQQSQAGGPQQTGTNGQQPGPAGMTDTAVSYDAAASVEADENGTNYASTANAQNAVLVDGKTVTLSDITVSKSGDASDENADFNGTNAAVLANNGATLTITGASVTTDGAHANGVFSYGTGTTVNISDSTITTSGNGSGGLMTTGGATLNATNMTVSTSGNSSAAIRSDRGGGTVTVSEGSYETSGVGSPAIYSTADITVSDATIAATNSEAVVIEGGNSVTLVNVDATGNNAKLNGQSTIATNVLIYQSMSGDASEGASHFSMTGGSLTALTGAMFHVTNVTTTIDLSGVALSGSADGDFLVATADSWGTAGKNGGHATVNLSSQEASGNITVDSVSSVTLNLQDSSYTGAIANKGTVKVTMDANSTWTLTGDSYVTSLEGDTSGINLNGYTLYVNGVAYAG